MKSLMERLEPFFSKPLKAEIKGASTSLWIIDWPAIAAAHDFIMDQTVDMDDEQAGEFLCDNETELIQITECFMNDRCDQKVEEEEWLPFGLLGLELPPAHYAEPENEGLLLLDLSKGNASEPSVILFRRNKAEVLHERLSDFLAGVHSL